MGGARGEEDTLVDDDYSGWCSASQKRVVSCSDRCVVGLGGLIRRVDQIKERGFPRTGCWWQYNQNAGGESASKEGAIGAGGQEGCRKRGQRAGKRAVSVLEVVMAMAGLGQQHGLGKDRLFFRKRASLGEV